MRDNKNEEDENGYVESKMIQIFRQKIILVTMNLCKEQVFYVHQLMFYY